MRALLPDVVKQIAIPDDISKPVHVETDELWRNVALKQGSKTFPKIEELVPARPPTAADCPEFNGSAVHPITSKKGYESVICTCGGMGWLPAGSHRDHFA